MVTEIENFNQIISDWIRDYYADGIFFLLAIGAFVYLYVTCKDLRYKFLLPIFVMVFIAVNPILYKYVFSKIVYWRLLWMLPNAILIAAAVVVFLKKQTKVWMKWGVFAVAAVVIMSQGQYMFSDGVFAPRSNWEKLSQETIDVCDIMLELDESPRAVVNSEINTEIRQYAPEIELLYGRDRHAYIRKIIYLADFVNWNLAIDPTCYWYVLPHINDNEYDFLVVSIDAPPIEAELLEMYEYYEVAKTAQHVIYCKKDNVLN